MSGIIINSDNEKIICAAIWYQNNKEYQFQPVNVKSGVVACGLRHPNCIVILKEMFYSDFQIDEKHDDMRIHCKQNWTQGFLTTANRFVDRMEGLKIATKQFQLKMPPIGDQLYSENLY